jgi:two-component system, NtrC family, sensor histidine kinase HydH
MAGYSPRVVAVVLAVLLLFASAAMVYVATENDVMLESLSSQSIENTALSISAAAETSLRLTGSHRKMAQVFSDRVVAYAFITDATGTILFHTNPRLVGSKFPGAPLTARERAKNSGRRITLGTGTPAFEFQYVIHSTTGTEEMLWLVLHTGQADAIVSSGRRIWWVVAFLLAATWTAGVLLWFLLSRYLRLQADVEQKNRMALVGQMTAVLAHEIRNALGGVKGYAQWVEEKASEPDAVREGTSFVVKGAERVENLVSELLLFSREETYEIGNFDLVSLIAETIPLALSGWSGALITELGKPKTVSGDREKVQRVLINVFHNALQAMGESGTLHVSLLDAGKQARVVVRDSGPGINADLLPRLFTPFFTTKTDGTGLGLAYCRKVMGVMGGAVALTNSAGGGAVATITLQKR